MTHRSFHGLHPIVVADLVCDLDEGSVSFGIGYLDKRVEYLVVVK